MRRRARAVLDRRRPARVDAGGLRPRRSPPCGAGSSRRRHPPPAPEPPARLADRRRLPRGGGDRRQGRATRSRSTGRASAWRSSSRSTAAPSRAPTRRPRAPAPPAPTSCSSCPRGGKVRAQDAAVARGARRPARVLGRQRALGAGRARARWSRPFADPGVGYAAAGCASSTRPARTRRASTGATRCGCASSESALASVTAGNGAIYAVRREAYLEVDRASWATTSRSRSTRQARLARGLRARGARDREDGAHRSRASGRASGG